MKEKLPGLGYLITVIYLSACHSIPSMLLILSFLIAISRRETIRILKRTILSVAVPNSIVTTSYAVMGNSNWLTFATIFNLRVLTITFLTLLITSKCNLFKILSFSKTLSTLLTLTYSQIALSKNTLNEFKLAFKSRALTKPDKKDLHNFIASSSYFFLNKALNSSEEMTQAMKSRGFFND